MPTPKKGPRLGSGPDHQRLMLSDARGQLFIHEGIKTTEAKAKVLRPYAENLITFAKKGDLARASRGPEGHPGPRRRRTSCSPRSGRGSQNAPGGYTRILKLGQRKGDGAPMARIELVEQG